MVKNLPAMQETWVQSLGQEDPLEKVKSLSRVRPSATPWTAAFVHGIFQARVLEWGAIAFSGYIPRMQNSACNITRTPYIFVDRIVLYKTQGSALFAYSTACSTEQH